MHRISNPIGHIISLATVLTQLAYAPRESPCPCMRRDTCTACSHWRTSSCSAHDNAIRDTPCPSFPRRYCTSNSGHLQQRDRQAHWLIRSGPTLSVELHTPPSRAESVAARPSYKTDSTNLQPQRRTSRWWDSFRVGCLEVTRSQPLPLLTLGWQIHGLRRPHFFDLRDRTLRPDP